MERSHATFVPQPLASHAENQLQTITTARGHKTHLQSTNSSTTCLVRSAKLVSRKCTDVTTRDVLVEHTSAGIAGDLSTRVLQCPA